MNKLIVMLMALFVLLSANVFAATQDITSTVTVQNEPPTIVSTLITQSGSPISSFNPGEQIDINFTVSDPSDAFTDANVIVWVSPATEASADSFDHYVLLDDTNLSYNDLNATHREYYGSFTTNTQINDGTLNVKVYAVDDVNQIASDTNTAVSVNTRLALTFADTTLNTSGTTIPANLTTENVVLKTTNSDLANLFKITHNGNIAIDINAEMFSSFTGQTYSEVIADGNVHLDVLPDANQSSVTVNKISDGIFSDAEKSAVENTEYSLDQTRAIVTSFQRCTGDVDNCGSGYTANIEYNVFDLDVTPVSADTYDGTIRVTYITS